MAQLKTQLELANEAQTLATSFEYVRYRKMIYAPVDYETGESDVIPPVERKAWVPVTVDELGDRAQFQFDTLFRDARERENFYFKALQLSQRVPEDSPIKLLIKTKEGLRVLEADGSLSEPTGEFIPNMLLPTLNTDPLDVEEMRNIVLDWVGGEEEELTSLLRHLATSLSPGWSAGKYILLIGAGRNGKSVLMTMLSNLFGKNNCSNVTRQEISDASPTMFDLNNKLVNIVFDGAETFLKDSGREKSLITGEEVWLRKLYQNNGSMVQTNALFIEGLNNEPKSKDKSSALQARLVRFWFPRKYADDLVFWKQMMSERWLGALLALLLEHVVLEEEVHRMLTPTQRSRELQLEHMEENSLALQYVMHVDNTDPLGAESLIDMRFDDVFNGFCSWRLQANDLTAWDFHTVLRMFRPVLDTERRSERVNGMPRKIRFVARFSLDTESLLAMQKEEEDATAVVDD